MAAGRVARVAIVAFCAVLAAAAGSVVVSRPGEASAPAAGGPRAAEIDLRFHQGVVMLHAKRHDHAIAAFHRVLELAPDMPEAHVDMGFALLGAGRPEAARVSFETATALRPRQANAYYGLAMALEALGDLPAARGAMRTYLHLMPAGDPYRRKAEAALWEWQAAAR